MLGCLGKSIMLWFVFSFVPNVPTCTCFIHVKLNPRCQGMLSALVPHTAVHKSSAQQQPLATPAHVHITESVRKDGRVHGMQGLSLTNSCVATKLLSRATGQMPSKPTHLHINNTFLIISSFMLNMDIDMLPCLPKVVLIYIYGTYVF